MAIEQIRTFLAITLLVVLFLLWQAWQEDYGPAFSSINATGDANQTTQPGMVTPFQGGRDIPLPPRTDSSVDNRMVPTLPGTDRAGESMASSDEENRPIRVQTDVFELFINPNGTGIYQLNLLAYPDSQDQPEVPFSLLSQRMGHYFTAEATLLGSDKTLHKPPRFRPEQHDYRLAEGEDTLEVRLPWDSGDGISVTKVMTFHRQSYAVDFSYEVKNAKEEPVAVRLHGKLTRYPPAGQNSIFRLPTYTGGVISNAEDLYQKVDFSDMTKQDLKHTSQGGWIAMIQHYFIGSWVPDPDAMNQYYTTQDGTLYTIAVSTDKIISPGGHDTISLRGYLGPKIQDRMEAVAPNLSRTVDYGWLWVISQPLFWLLKKIHSLLGNWGVAIIILTLLIKLVFFHLSATSYRSMAKMRKLQPRMVKLRDTYKDDKVKMNQRLMELYKEEGVNPVSGCLPIAVQIPVFIALYWVLLESVELRHAGFLWLSDLSTYDPFFILPVSMGITMFLQQKLNPTPPDPIQAKVMMALPFVFTFLFLFFPSGLVLYWFVNNVLSIAQQWVITRQIIAPNT
ncbi:MAG: membrane protein insertase YidC [Gammaproteobacteria bacterium]|nr:membrane protein insertase YidC [Gammaproteobacteria bacterium]NNJ84161.1 membrane protein insertase YidC [Gammaproteobacteria bacterium]